MLKNTSSCCLFGVVLVGVPFVSGRTRFLSCGMYPLLLVSDIMRGLVLCFAVKSKGIVFRSE